ncbi:DHHC zinc finger domain containing protein [Tritrichomonas foetus]|uniref:Palmitoyltransferase n=1 Tax=Tritrichomonas foetus TaxID=1144522 RepID=A0A1J4KB37_9EUKA|nr:DHHC zinc finger domain containing protein [Tritrichomonas foetus]|eukprot:OHT08633.1 DHHC zinc finger domain containing protein [Tritrichomonas foetus]
MAEKALQSQDMEQQADRESNDPLIFPGFTEWRDLRFCCLHFYSIPNLHQLFCGHWEVVPFFPILFFLLSTSSLLIVTIFALPYFGIEGQIMIAFMVILFFLFIYSYFRIITDGPGYYPFYWGTPYQPPDIENSLLNNNYDSPSGIISKAEQFEWCQRRHEKPPRSILSRTARRYVLRPEHYCKWASSWIGKRNHKFFMLFTFYGILYLGLFVVYLARRMVQCFSDNFSFSMLLLTVYGVSAAAFFLMLVSFFVSNMIDISLSRTSWEQWNGIDAKTFDQGTWMNFEDVFGPKEKCVCWICPLSPWKNMSNDEIASTYKYNMYQHDSNQPQNFT